MLGYYEVPVGFNSLITAELEKGEKILWQGHPQPYYFSSRSVSNFIGGLVGFCISSIFFFNVFRYSPDLAGITEVAIILFMFAFLSGVVVSVSSPLRQYRRLSNTLYLLTNRRAMEIVVRRKPHIRSWPIDSITQVRLKEKTVSLGNVEIIQGIRIVGDGSNEQKGFFHIKRAREVARQLDRVIDSEKKIVVQDSTNEQVPAFTGSQRLLEEDSINENKIFPFQLLNSDLFRLALFILLAVVLFGTPAALAWGTNTGEAGFVFFLLLFVIFGLINPMRYQDESRHWPSTEGVVEESWIAKCIGENSPSYNPHVLYRYRVEDKVYRDSSIDIPGVGDTEMLSRIAAERKVAPYQEGTSVTVYYDPKRPWFSVLEVGNVDHSYWLGVIILLPFLIWSGYHIYTTWPGLEPDRYQILWEEVMGGDEGKSGKRHVQGEKNNMNEAKYIGERKDGKKHGKGTYTWPDGTKYVGEFKDGKEHGQGERIYPGGLTYIGEWKNGRRDGKGTLTWSDGTKYTGEWKGGGRQGHGERIYSDGDRYIGEWKDGKKHGKGTYTWANGTKYTGEWKDDEIHGHGERIYSDGDRYIGEWKDGKKNGKGTYTWANGTKYTGEWKDDEIHGHGERIYSDGDRYIGEWKDGKKHGKGTYTLPDGSKSVGIWNNGELQEIL